MSEPVPQQRIPRRPHPGITPLSAAQQRFWFFEQFAPGTRIYNRPFGLRLRGPLDVDALERALDDVVARHEVLRTTFSAEGGSPVQHVATSHVMPFELVEVGRSAAGDREAAAARLALDFVLRPIDLAAGPITRALLIRIEDGHHVLVLTVHHIAFDGWSAGVLFRELADCYTARNAGREPELPPLPIQYGDVLGRNGALVAVIRWADGTREVGADDVTRHNAQRLAGMPPDIRRQFEALPVSDRFPAYSELAADAGGNLWVKAFRTPLDSGPDPWLIFDAEGALVARIEIPGELRILDIGVDWLLGDLRDELGVERVALYTIRKQ